LDSARVRLDKVSNKIAETKQVIFCFDIGYSLSICFINRNKA
jgi:hypothetical protein